MSIFGGGNNGTQKIDGVRVTQSILGNPRPVVMGRQRVAQSLLWMDGFTGKKESQGGKGGGKGGQFYIYSADVAAALCNGPIVGINDVWTGQSWLSNNTTAENYTIAGSGIFTPSNAGTLATDHGVGVATTFSNTYNDPGAPSPTTLSGSDISPLRRVAFGTTLTTGLYSIDPSTGNYHFNTSADAGKVVTINYSFRLQEIRQQENDLIPSGKQIQVGGTITFVADFGVIYLAGGSIGNALTKVGGTPTATGTYSVSGSGPATYHFAPGDIGNEVQITYQVRDLSVVGQDQPTMLNFELFTGEQSQTEWSLLSGTYPGQALGYTKLAFVGYDPMDLGTSAQIQDNTFEVQTADNYGAGFVDCNPVTCILRVLTDNAWGLGTGAVPFPASVIDNGAGGTWGGAATTPGTRTLSSTAWDWWAANGFLISPIIDSQDTAASTMAKWLEAGMVAAFYSEGLLKLRPYGDTSVAGNGSTWIACGGNLSQPSNFIASLDDTNFVPSSDGQDPVKIERSAWQDGFNEVQVNWNNRASQYAPEITQESDQAAINRFGHRLEDPQSWDFICNITPATFAANMRVKRMVNIRNTYTFTLPFTYSYLEPMDNIEITTSSVWAQGLNNANLGIVNLPLRITKVVDDPAKGLEITCEDFPFGVHQPVLFNKGSNAAEIVANTYANPGQTEIVMFEATTRLTQQQGNQIWIGAAGASNDWGATNVFVSSTGSGGPYLQVGTIKQPSRMGVLTNVDNLLLFSQKFDNAVWSKAASVTVTPNATTDPLGGSTADEINFPSKLVNTFVGVFQDTSVIVPVAGQTYTFSVWLKSTSGTPTVEVTLQDAPFSGTWNGSSVVTLSTSWQRFSCTGTVLAGTNPALDVQVRSPFGSVVGAFSIYAWGAQLEPGTSASIYIQTEGTAVTAANALPSGSNNLILFSQKLDNPVWKMSVPGVTVTPNATTDPLGGTTADEINLPSKTASMFVGLFQDTSVIVPVAGQTYTVSVYLKATSGTPSVEVTLQDSPFSGTWSGGGLVTLSTSWQRFQFTGTVLAGTNPALDIQIRSPFTPVVGAFSIFAWGAQLETGSQVSAYVATEGNPVTPADPDIVNTMMVDLVVNSAALEAGTSADADNGNTMCFVDGEILSYSTAVVTGQDQTTCGGYLRRGQMGSAITAHAAGSLFLRLDSGVFKFTYDPTWYGKTLFFKFQSVNHFDNNPIPLQDLTPVSFTVPGKNPGTVEAGSGLVLAQTNVTVGAGMLGWTPIATSLDTTINFNTPGFGFSWSGVVNFPGAVNIGATYTRWVGFIVPSVTGKYTLGVNSDDGASLYIAGFPVVNNLTARQGANSTSLTYTQSGTLTLTKGVSYPVVLEYQNAPTTGGGIQLLWTPPGAATQLIPTANLSTSQGSVTGNLAGTWWNGTTGLWYPSGSGLIDPANTVLYGPPTNGGGTNLVGAVTPVTGTQTSPQSGNTFFGPGWIVGQAYSAAGIVDIFVCCGSTTQGYLFRLDYRNGFSNLISVVSNLASSLGTTITLSSTNASNITGWENFAIYMSASGYMSLWINGVLVCQATDTTFPMPTASGVQTRYFNEVNTTGKVTPVPNAAGAGSTGLNQQGSVIPIQPINDPTWTTTSSSISLSWPSSTVALSDGSSVTIASGTKVYSGLSASTAYYLYPYVNIATLTVLFANGSPPPTSPNASDTIIANSDGTYTMNVLTITTGTVGGGGGSGGGGIRCPESNELVEVLGRGQIKVSDVLAGDMIRGFSFQTNADVYRKVLSITSSSGAAWRVIDGHKVSPCEPVWEGKAWMPAHRVPGATLDTTIGMKAMMHVDSDEYDECNYWLYGGTAPLLIHNLLPPGS